MPPAPLRLTLGCEPHPRNPRDTPRDHRPDRFRSPVSRFLPATPPTDLPAGAIVINATSAGLRPEDPVPIDLATLPRPVAVFDMIYNPPQTALLRAAADRGLRTPTASPCSSTKAPNPSNTGAASQPAKRPPRWPPPPAPHGVSLDSGISPANLPLCPPRLSPPRKIRRKPRTVSPARRITPLRPVVCGGHETFHRHGQKRTAPPLDA